ncbi:unnamed protein product [Adineta steineri]|uniref:Uncharacterized protein n=1 Tax=Adineta steineri TaxID=433720 RepID=A0A818T0M5_9BILA|nr:unnamed protein product [Adineta steineri]
MSQNNVHHRKRVVRRQYNLTDDKQHIQDESLTIFDKQQQQQQQEQQEQQHRASFFRKKPGGLICTICEGPAHGYNFDAVTCESCKAFFRRNALKFDEKVKCRINDGNCIINMTTRKRCKACRLAKCFEQGMRADWILTDEERMNKRRKIEENRRLRKLVYPDSADSDDVSKSPYVDLKSELMESDNKEYSTVSTSILSSEDLFKIEQIKHAYADSVRLTSLPREIPSYPNTTKLNFTSEMVNLPTNLQASRLITFLKLIPEFSSLDEHDKLVLIKHNTFPLLFIRSALVYNRATDSYYDQGTDDCVFSGKDLIQCFSLDQYEKSTRCVCRVMDASHNDPFIIQIFLLIMILSKGSSVCTYTEEFEPVANNIQSLFHTQNIFVNLLLKYCESKFGYTQTVHIWLKLVMSSIDAHLQSHTTRYNFVKKDDVAEQLVPLMKSVLLNA